MWAEQLVDHHDAEGGALGLVEECARNERDVDRNRASGRGGSVRGAPLQYILVGGGDDGPKEATDAHHAHFVRAHDEEPLGVHGNVHLCAAAAARDGFIRIHCGYLPTAARDTIESSHEMLHDGGDVLDFAFSFKCVLTCHDIPARRLGLFHQH